jgi:hypothetical protein
MSQPTSPPTDRRRAPSGGDSFDAWFERWWPAVWALALGVIAAGAAGQAAGRLLWHDELFTLYGATFDLAELWQALAGGYDLQPPLGYLLTGLSISALGDGLITARLPSLVGFLTGSLAIGVLVRREAGTLAGTIALLVPSVTAAYDYAYEARPYGVVLGVAGLSVLAWQLAGIPKLRAYATVGLALTLGAGVSLHYYAALLVLPLAVGEIARTQATGQRLAGVWAAMAAGLLPLAAFIPLMSAAAAYGELFWTRASPAQLPYTYRYFLLPIVLPAVLWLLALAARAIRVGAIETNGEIKRPATATLVLMVALLLLPLAGLVLGGVVGGYRHRYVIPMVLGFAGLAAMLLAPAREASRVLLVVLSLWLTGRGLSHAAPLLGPPPELLTRHPTLRMALTEPGLPIVVTNDALYTQLNHYGADDLKKRLLVVMPPVDPVAGRFEDSSERAMRALSRWHPIAIAEYDELRAAGRPYYVYGDKHWLLVQIRADGGRAEMLGEGFGHTLVRVTPRPGAAAR